MFRNTADVTFKIPDGTHSALKRIRLSYGLSIKEAAHRYGVSASSLSQIERGLRPLSEELARCVAIEHNISPHLLLIKSGIIPTEILEELMEHSEEFLLGLNDRFERYRH